MRRLFGGRTSSLDLRRQAYVETASSPREYFDLFRYSFGPMVAIHGALNNEPGRSAELDEAFRQFIMRWNRDSAEGGVRVPYEYLLVIARPFDSLRSLRV